MKKIKAFFVVLVVCLLFLSSIGQVFAAKSANSYTVVDLVRLKKHIITEFTYNSEFDYNNDKRVNSLDLATLRIYILDPSKIPNIPDDDDSKFDDDGYYNEVVKP